MVLAVRPDIRSVDVLCHALLQSTLTEYYRYLKESRSESQDWQPQQPEEDFTQNRKVNYDPEQFE